MSQIYLFWSDTLHVLDGLSVHRQEFKTVRTATGICQTEIFLNVFYSFNILTFNFMLRRYLSTVCFTLHHNIQGAADK